MKSPFRAKDFIIIRNYQSNKIEKDLKEIVGSIFNDLIKDTLKNIKKTNRMLKKYIGKDLPPGTLDLIMPPKGTFVEKFNLLTPYLEVKYEDILVKTLRALEKRKKKSKKKTKAIEDNPYLVDGDYFNQANEHTYTAIRKQKNLIRGAADSTYDKLKKELKYAINDGKPLYGNQGDNIEKAVKKIFPEKTRIETERIARTESMRTANTANNIAYEVTDSVIGYQWLTIVNEGTRASHLTLNGKKILKGESFKENLKYPLDPNAPAQEVVNCRCTALPLMDEKEMEPGFDITEVEDAPDSLKPFREKPKKRKKKESEWGNIKPKERAWHDKAKWGKGSAVQKAIREVIRKIPAITTLRAITKDGAWYRPYDGNINMSGYKKRLGKNSSLGPDGKYLGYQSSSRAESTFRHEFAHKIDNDQGFLRAYYTEKAVWNKKGEFWEFPKKIKNGPTGWETKVKIRNPTQTQRSKLVIDVGRPMDESSQATLLMIESAMKDANIFFKTNKLGTRKLKKFIDTKNLKKRTAPKGYAKVGEAGKYSTPWGKDYDQPSLDYVKKSNKFPAFTAGDGTQNFYVMDPDADILTITINGRKTGVKANLKPSAGFRLGGEINWDNDFLEAFGGLGWVDDAELAKMGVKRTISNPSLRKSRMDIAGFTDRQGNYWDNKRMAEIFEEFTEKGAASGWGDIVDQALINMQTDGNRIRHKLIAPKAVYTITDPKVFKKYFKKSEFLDWDDLKLLMNSDSSGNKIDDLFSTLFGEKGSELTKKQMKALDGLFKSKHGVLDSRVLDNIADMAKLSRNDNFDVLIGQFKDGIGGLSMGQLGEGHSINYYWSDRVELGGARIGAKGVKETFAQFVSNTTESEYGEVWEKIWFKLFPNYSEEAKEFLLDISKLERVIYEELGG